MAKLTSDAYMKTAVQTRLNRPALCLLAAGALLLSCTAYAQVTTPVIRAGFGVDGDLRANHVAGVSISGNDDWFRSGSSGAGRQVIDTNGAAAIYARYLSDVNSRRV